MRQVWLNGIFDSVEEGKQWIYEEGNPLKFKLPSTKGVLETISTNKQVFDAFLGKTEPLMISFVYTAENREPLFDDSEFFLLVEKFDLTFIEGLWNREVPFNESLARDVFKNTFEKLNTENV